MKTNIEDTMVRGDRLIATLESGEQYRFPIHNGRIALGGPRGPYYEFRVLLGAEENTAQLIKGLRYIGRSPQDAGWPVE